LSPFQRNGKRDVPMTLCNAWSVVKRSPDAREAKPLPCRSWNCEFCAPKRRVRLMAQAASGRPNRLLTLTSNPRAGVTPTERFRLLRWASHLLFQRLRRIPKYGELAYFCIVEATKLGEPHLHILVRSPMIPQRLISSIMDELIDAPIVDIRALHNPSQAIRYVAKYITKAPARFGESKRYWSSQNWEAPNDFTKAKAEKLPKAWALIKEHVRFVIKDWPREGFAVRNDGAGGFYGIRTGHTFGLSP